MKIFIVICISFISCFIKLGETFSLNLDFVSQKFSLTGLPALKLEKTVQWANLSLSCDNRQSSLVNDNFHFAYRTSRLIPQLGIGIEKENGLLYFIESKMKEIDFFEDWIFRNINSSELKYSVQMQYHQSESLHENNFYRAAPLESIEIVSYLNITPKEGLITRESVLYPIQIILLQSTKDFTPIVRLNHMNCRESQRIASNKIYNEHNTIHEKPQPNCGKLNTMINDLQSHIIANSHMMQFKTLSTEQTISMQNTPLPFTVDMIFKFFHFPDTYSGLFNRIVDELKLGAQNLFFIPDIARMNIANFITLQDCSSSSELMLRALSCFQHSLKPRIRDVLPPLILLDGLANISRAQIRVVKSSEKGKFVQLQTGPLTGKILRYFNSNSEDESLKSYRPYDFLNIHSKVRPKQGTPNSYIQYDFIIDHINIDIKILFETFNQSYRSETERDLYLHNNLDWKVHVAEIQFNTSQLTSPNDEKTFLECLKSVISESLEDNLSESRKMSRYSSDYNKNFHNDLMNYTFLHMDYYLC